MDLRDGIASGYDATKGFVRRHPWPVGLGIAGAALGVAVQVAGVAATVAAAKTVGVAAVSVATLAFVVKGLVIFADAMDDGIKAAVAGSFAPGPLRPRNSCPTA